MKAKLLMKKIEKMKNLIRKILRIKKNKKSISPNIFPRLHNYILSKMQNYLVGSKKISQVLLVKIP